MKPQPLNTHHQPALQRSENTTSGTQSAKNSGRVVAWRDFAVNPEPLKNYPQLQRTAGSRKVQDQHGTSSWIVHDPPAQHSNDDASEKSSEIVPSNKPDEEEDNQKHVQSESNTTSKKAHPTDPGPRDPYNHSDKHNDTSQPDDSAPATGMRRQHEMKPTGLGAYPQAEKKHIPALSSTDSESVAPAPMRSPDIRDMQIPRPNRNYCASVRSMVSVLSLEAEDNTRGDHLVDPSPMKHSDIRSKIGLEPTLHMSGGKLINTDIWAEKARKPGDDFLNPVYANPWIEDYVENQIDYDVHANFLYEVDSVVHCHSDVDTFSGDLLKPYQHDYTVPDYMNSGSVHRQMTSNASLYVKRKAIKSNGRYDNPGPARPPPGWVGTPTPLSTATPEPPGPAKQARPVARPRAQSDPDSFAPRIACHVRPAIREDMEGVRDIYKWEVLNGLQALDTEPLCLAEWQAILKKTQDNKLPFVVVIHGPYRSQDGPPRAGYGPVPLNGLAGKVLAFGFLTIRQPGLAGSFDGTSRMSAKAQVFVHPEYRRKKLGHICLDKLLSTISTRYATKGGYKFVNIGDNPTYNYPRHHDRKIYSVFVEHLVPRNRVLGTNRFLPDETDLKWFERVVTSRYGFYNVGRLGATHRSRRTYEPSPIWLDTVMFEHMCQEGLDFTQIL